MCRLPEQRFLFLLFKNDTELLDMFATSLYPRVPAIRLFKLAKVTVLDQIEGQYQRLKDTVRVFTGIATLLLSCEIEKRRAIHCPVEFFYESFGIHNIEWALVSFAPGNRDSWI